MSRHFCMVPGCHEEGRHALTVRLRRPDTTAVWAPTTGAFVCDRHATEGCEIDIVWRPKRTGQVVTKTLAEYRGQQGTLHERLADITQGARRNNV